jgi:hypothetical protein
MRFKAGSAAVHRLLRIRISNARGTQKRNRKNHSWMDIFSDAPNFHCNRIYGRYGWMGLGEGSEKEVRTQGSALLPAAPD